MRILAVDALRPGSDHDSYVWRTTWLRRRFQEGHIAKVGEHLLGDSGYSLEPRLLTPVPGLLLLTLQKAGTTLHTHPRGPQWSAAFHF
ncbi:hypothetical protein HPB49_025122 [Dermacentor silvarum]|uniref:Uncharacterized protein n=1 Tax=Dermacentor silvarum TaxID=543639 RepID=A0ACB8D9A7_DERSI|nr:hypothetical protein HPB49_025122 [Dermacentor silvarum]